MELKLAAVCETCTGTGLVHWGRNRILNCEWYVACPTCRPDEPRRHPHHATVRLGDRLE